MSSIPVTTPLTEYFYRRASVMGVPLSGTFELTPLCNMDCKMCYVRLTKSEQERIGHLHSADDWLKLAETARDAGMLYLLITGGEPFLHPQIQEILEGLSKLGLVVSINSNGTMIDENVVSWLKKTPPTRVNISIYGASDETYAKLCNNPKGFTEMTRAVHLLKEAGISVKLNCSLTPHNVHDLQGIVDFAKDNNLIVQVATYMFPQLRKSGDNIGINDRLTPEQAAYYTAYSEYLLLGKELFLKKNSGFPIDIEEHCAEVGDGIRCRAGKCSFWINWNGKITPCGMFPDSNFPNVFEIPFEQAWNEVKKYTSSIVLPAKCAGCSAKDECRACAAMVITESGFFDKVPRYRCDMTHCLKEQWDRVKEEIK